MLFVLALPGYFKPCFVFRITVTLLDFADQPIAFSCDNPHSIVSQLAPFLSGFAFELLPVAAYFTFIGGEE